MSMDGRELRNALGRFATGICVISTLDGRERPVGMTANSFSSVSLDPPLVLWSLQNNSEMYDTFATPARYAINILGRDQEAISNQFASKGEHLMDEGQYVIGEHGAPLLKGALVSFQCELHETHAGGDHLIIVGRVLAMVSHSDEEPLLFYGGQYRALG